VEFESPATGIVRKFHFPEEAVVKVGAVIASLEAPGSESLS
jgi:pyruvate/2-oxoglutarate dehydrogenase complex dihydrolipoamide acyltransferase (E2) component